MGAKISVCITSYNRPAALERTLESLAAQAKLPDEVIVSDDCSPVETEPATLRWGNHLPGFRFVRNPRNLGMPGNLNSAIRHATGDYIANLHDADTFAPTLLERWEGALDEHPTAGFVFCGISGWPHPTREGNGVILHNVLPLTPGRVFYESHLLHRFSSIIWGTVMARRVAYARLLPFDDRFGYVSDVDMWMRMCRHFDVAYVRAPLIHLDHTPQFRGHAVNWQMTDWTREIQLLNIERFFGADHERMSIEMKHHRHAARRFLIRRFAGRLRHGDWRGGKQALLRLKAWGVTPFSTQASQHVR
jgi:glycosyltransferase involved in cell wall biosynthesis